MIQLGQYNIFSEGPTIKDILKNNNNKKQRITQNYEKIQSH